MTITNILMVVIMTVSDLKTIMNILLKSLNQILMSKFQSYKPIN